jgi:uncharacterized Rmd1/YagE family protein
MADGRSKDGSVAQLRRFFTSSDYRFSTKAKDRKETLYFEDQTTKQTGRLRQEHSEGKLAKIDGKTKRRKFVSKKRYEFLNKRHKKHPKQLPRFYSYEQQKKVGKHHIEFAFERGKVSRWHKSEGTVVIRTGKVLDCCIASALECIFGIRSKKTKK